MMKERLVKIMLLGTALVMWVIFFLLESIHGDISSYGYWQFPLYKIHLLSELTMPYFTPARCGGWLLAADAQGMIFSAYMLISFFITNVDWAIRITNFLMTFILCAGVYRWLQYFGVIHKVARLFVAIFVTVSGYWVYHLTLGGHVWCHGLAYTPWIMVGIEELLKQQPSRKRPYLILWMSLAGLFFLLINSGYYWLQVAVPLIAYRFLAEFVFSGKERLQQTQRMGIICLAGLAGILLSLIRLGGVYEFQLKNFPRTIGHLQVIGSTSSLIENLWRSFFDPRLILNMIGSPGMLGLPWDYNNFIGLAAILPLLIGLFKIKNLWKHRAFVSLVLASLAHLAVLRTTRVGDLVRTLFPIFQSITWHWRGTAILVLLASVVIACGYEQIFRSRKKVIVLLGIGLMFLNLGEILYANHKLFVFPPKPSFNEIMKPYVPPPKNPLISHWAPCNIDNLFGYGNCCPSQLSITACEGAYEWNVPVDLEPQPGFYNMHDVRRLAGPEAKGGYYLTHDWPLWPRTDSAEFEKFINYKQVVPIPARLRIMNRICGLSWLAYVVFFLGLMITGRRKK